MEDLMCTLNGSETEEVWFAVCIPSRSPAPESSLGIFTPVRVTSQRGVSGGLHASCLLSTPGFPNTASSMAHPAHLP